MILGWTFPIRIRTHREAKDIPNMCVKILSYQQVKSSYESLRVLQLDCLRARSSLFRSRAVLEHCDKNYSFKCVIYATAPQAVSILFCATIF